MDAVVAKAVAKVIAATTPEVRKATVYLGPKLVVSACWRNKAFTHKRSTRRELVLKIGTPNYLEARFINACKKAGEPFPVKKVQLQPWPKPRGA
jgi:hypothetical protein